MAAADSLGWRLPTSLAGQAAVVTGGAQGLGRGIALSLAGNGCSIVAVLDLESQRDKGESVVAELSALGCGAATFVPCDVTSAAAVASAMASVASQAPSGRLNIVVANAGRIPPDYSDGIDMANEAFELTRSIMYSGVFHTLKYGAQAITANVPQQTQQQAQQQAREDEETPEDEVVKLGSGSGGGGCFGGRLIYIGSTMGDQCQKGRVDYASCKAACRSMVKTMALELAPLGVTVNEVAPGHIETEGNPSSRPPESIPLQRKGTVRDVGHAVAFLASPAASYITGSVLHVDGGYLTGLQLPK